MATIVGELKLVADEIRGGDFKLVASSMTVKRLADNTRDPRLVALYDQLLATRLEWHKCETLVQEAMETHVTANA
jgi:hypothetical protein